MLSENFKTERARAASSPEAALLLACSRLRMRDEDRLQLQAALDSGLNWNLLLSLARFHGLIALMHKHLREEFSGKVPAGIMAQLREEAGATARKNLGLSAELMALLRLFADHGIPVLPLKGPVLAEYIYGSVGLRRMRDLDLLFKDSDILRAVELLQARGYENQYPLPAVLDEIDRRYNHHLVFLSPRDGHLVELHRCMVGARRKRYDLEAILGRTQPASFMGIPIVTFSPEDLLVYLCEHGSNHVWYRLEWLCGIAELLRSGRIESWDRVLEFASQLDAQKRVRTSLWIAHQLLDAPVPEEMLVLDRFRKRTAHSVIVRFLTEPGRWPTTIDMVLYLLLTEDGLVAALHRIWMYVPPSVGDVRSMPLPRLLWPAYYLLRPFRLVIRHGRRVLGGLDR